MAHRNKKPSNSILNSATFVGLRAENSHISNLHVDALYNKTGKDVFEMIESLQKQITELRTLASLTDVCIDNPVVEGNVLIWENEKWRPRELFEPEK
jgi:hypothetical protein